MFLPSSWSNGLMRKSFKLVWRCQQLLSGFLTNVTCPECHVNHVCQLTIRVIMKWSWGLCTDLLAFAWQLRKTSVRRPSDEGAVRPVIASNGVIVMQFVERYLNLYQRNNLILWFIILHVSVVQYVHILIYLSFWFIWLFIREALRVHIIQEAVGFRLSFVFTTALDARTVQQSVFTLDSNGWLEQYFLLVFDFVNNNRIQEQK